MDKPTRRGVEYESDFATTDEDTYFSMRFRNDGCIVEDTIEVNYTAEFLNAFFIAPTDIVEGDTIVALEVFFTYS